MATHSSILAWRTPWTEEPVGYSPCGCRESDTAERLHFTHRCIWNHSMFSCLLFPLTIQDLRAPVLPFYGQSFFSIPTFPSAAVSILFVFNNGSDG